MKMSVRLVLALIPMLVLVGLIAVFATQMGRDTSVVPSALIDRPAPAFALPGVDGLDQPGFATADLAGSGVSVVNVFASWCVPCRAEHPYLMDLAERDLATLYGLNYDDPAENARAFLDELGNPYAAVGADRDRRVGIEWGVYGVPETFVVDASGTITYKHVGPLSETSYREQLIPAIEAAARQP